MLDTHLTAQGHFNSDGAPYASLPHLDRLCIRSADVTFEGCSAGFLDEVLACMKRPPRYIAFRVPDFDGFFHELDKGTLLCCVALT